MASNMGIPEKKTDTLLYIIIVCCIIAFPVIVLVGYTLEMTAGKNGNIQIFEAIESKDLEKIEEINSSYKDAVVYITKARLDIKETSYED